MCLLKPTALIAAMKDLKSVILARMALLLTSKP